MNRLPMEAYDGAFLVVGRKFQFPADLMPWKSGWTISKGIQHATGSWSNHVEWLSYQPGKYPNGLRSYGAVSKVRETNAGKYLNDRAKYRWEIRAFRSPLTDEHKGRMLAFARANLNEGYSWAKIARIRWALFWNGYEGLQKFKEKSGDQEVWICTGYANAIAGAADLAPFDLKYIAPRHFLESDKLVTIAKSE